MIKADSKTNLVLAAVILAATCLSCSFIKGKLSTDPLGNIETPLPTSIPTFDPEAPLASPGAEVIRRMAQLDPGLAPLAAKFEAVERETMRKAIAEASGNNTSVPERARLSRPADPSPDFYISNASFKAAPRPAAILMLQGGSDTAESRANGAAVAGAIVAGLKDIFTKDYDNAKNGGGVNKETKETKDGVTTTMGVELILRDDGSSAFGLGMKTESVQNGKKVVSEVKGRVDGLDCPNAEGQVPITINLRLGGESGGVGYTQDMTVFLRASVDDNAEVVSRTLDITEGTRQLQNGREVYIETGQTIKYDAKSVESSNFRVVRYSQSAWENREEARGLAAAGQEAAFTVGLTVLAMARTKWRTGGCVRIVADSPGSVAVSSTTQIPVSVTSKFGAGEVPSKLEALLSGESSVSPTIIPKTAGTLSYVAPGEAGKSATIKLTATSRRGIATLDLTANTGGGSYQIVGGLDDWQTNTKVCDIMKPFKLTGTYGISMDLTGGLSGTYTYSGQFQAHGSGTYTITLPDGPGKPGKMVGTGPGSAMGHSGSGTENYTLTPIDPCN